MCAGINVTVWNNARPLHLLVLKSGKEACTAVGGTPFSLMECVFFPAKLPRPSCLSAQFNPLITILAVIVNINDTEAHDASLPFAIRAIIVTAPTCNLN